MECSTVSQDSILGKRCLFSANTIQLKDKIISPIGKDTGLVTKALKTMAGIAEVINSIAR